MAKLIIDADDLIMAFDDHDSNMLSPRHFLDLETGVVEYCPMDEYLDSFDDLHEQIDTQPERYRLVPSLDSSEGYRHMEAFIEQLQNTKVANRLLRAISGKSPFRRFKEALLEYPDTREAWFRFRELKMLEIVQSWLESEEIEATLKHRMLKPSIELTDYIQRRINEEQVIWFTTVKPDGAPVPTPVWYLWSNEAFLIFSSPNTLKVRNILTNPHVTLNFNGDPYGGNIVVFSGEAVIDSTGASASEVAAYIAKYADGMKQIGDTPESFARKYSTVIRVKPTRVRADE